jgi:hypothetical protein
MAVSHQVRVGRALELLVRGSRPFVERELQAAYGDRWVETVQNSLRNQRDVPKGTGDEFAWDAQLILIVMTEHWNPVFRSKLGPFERSLLSELREFRNDWAHQREFRFDDTYRVLDSVERLLAAVGSRDADDVHRQRDDLLRNWMQTVLRSETRSTRHILMRGWQVGIYCMCCLILLVQTAYRFGWPALTFGLMIVAALTFFIRQWLRQPEAEFGLHECERCGRIIYREPCPYCVRVPGPDRDAELHPAETSMAG